MARRKNSANGRLEEAVATLIQNQVSFLARVSETDRRLADTERINSERFNRIEAILHEHSRILAEHSRILAELFRMLEALPETLREKIGFKPPQKPAPSE